MKSPRHEPSTKGLLPKAPPKLSAEEENLWATHDFVELEYRQINVIRRRRKRTPEQQEMLAKHDATERQIEAHPIDVMREAHEAIDHGTSLLLKLVRSEQLKRRYPIQAESPSAEWDQSFECLESRIDYLNRQLVRLAGAGVPNARRAVFYQSKMLAEAFIQLAQAHPEDFINAAESTLTMPSLRARNPKYTANAEAIAKSIHLGDKHPVGTTPDDRTRIGELCGYLVADILSEIESARKHYKSNEETLKVLQNFCETADMYRGLTVEEFLKGKLYPTLFEDVVASAALPEFRSDPMVWWQNRVTPMLRREFDRLKKNPSVNSGLWDELGKATDNGTDGARWKVLSDNCRNKVKQFARRAGAKTFV